MELNQGSIKNIEVIKASLLYEPQTKVRLDDYENSFVDIEKDYAEVFYYCYMTRYQKHGDKKQLCFYDHPKLKEMIIDYLKQDPDLFLLYTSDNHNLSEDKTTDISFHQFCHQFQHAFEKIIFYYEQPLLPLTLSLDDCQLPKAVYNIFKQLGYHYIDELYVDITLKDKVKQYRNDHDLDILTNILLDLSLDMIDGKIKVVMMTDLNLETLDFMIKHQLKNTIELFKHQDYHKVYKRKPFLNQKVSFIESIFTNPFKDGLCIIDNKLFPNFTKKVYLFHYLYTPYLLVESDKYDIYHIDNGKLRYTKTNQVLIQTCFKQAKIFELDLYNAYALYKYCVFNDLNGEALYHFKENQVDILDQSIDTIIKDDPTLIKLSHKNKINTIIDLLALYYPIRFFTLDQLLNQKDHYFEQIVNFYIDDLFIDID